MIDTETNRMMASVPSYSDNCAWAVGDNRVLYAMQRKGGNIGWKLVSFDGSVVNQFNWPTTVRETANTPCSFAAILANDVIVIGCAENHGSFIDARKKKELCTLHIPLEDTKFPIVQPSLEFYCVSPGRFIIRDKSGIKLIDFESCHILAEKNVVVLNTDGTIGSVKARACDLISLAQEKIQLGRIRVFRIWEASTVRLSMIASNSATFNEVNELASKLYTRRKRDDTVLGIGVHSFSTTYSKIEFVTTGRGPEKITDNAIVFKEQLVDEEWQLVDYEFTVKHFI